MHSPKLLNKQKLPNPKLFDKKKPRTESQDIAVEECQLSSPEITAIGRSSRSCRSKPEIDTNAEAMQGRQECSWDGLGNLFPPEMWKNHLEEKGLEEEELEAEKTLNWDIGLSSGSFLDGGDEEFWASWVSREYIEHCFQPENSYLPEDGILTEALSRQEEAGAEETGAEETGTKETETEEETEAEEETEGEETDE